MRNRKARRRTQAHRRAPRRKRPVPTTTPSPTPATAAHSLFDGPRLLATLSGFAAFSLCASATYIINDLLDVASDCAHPRKRERPFASGALSPQAGILAAGVLLPLSLVFGWLLSPMSCAVLAA